MAVTERTYTLPAQWASTAQTATVPPLVTGVSYRNTAVDAVDIARGQEFDRVYDSSRHNQFHYLVSGITMLAELYAGIPYCPLTNYDKDCRAMGADGKVYIATIPSGPNNGGAQPTTNGTYWKEVNAEMMSIIEEIRSEVADALTDAPSDGKMYGRQDGAWVEVEGLSEDAPEDGKIYGRQDGAWVEVEGGLGDDAPEDNQTYGRKNGSWVVVEGAGGGGTVEEAPLDGKQYARQNGVWTEVSGGGSGGVGEAPANGKYYARKDNGWTDISGMLSGGGGSGNGNCFMAAMSYVSASWWRVAKQPWATSCICIISKSPGDDGGDGNTWNGESYLAYAGLQGSNWEVYASRSGTDIVMSFQY